MVLNIETDNGIEVFFTIVGSKSTYMGMKPSLNQVVEILENSCMRFMLEEVDLCNSCVLVNKS